MGNVAISLGILLILLGIGAYFGTGRESVTALIPAFFGLPLAILGCVGRVERWNKHAMHAATVIALLGLVGSARGVPQVWQLAIGGAVARPIAAVVQTLMAAVCLVFLVLAIRSFVAARRARRA
jgi:hypothetical protein